MKESIERDFKGKIPVQLEFRRRKSEDRLFPVIAVLSIFSGIPIVMVLAHWYYSFQIAAFSSMDRILLIHDPVSLYFITFLPMVVLFSFLMGFRNRYLGLVFRANRYFLSGFLSLLALIAVLFFQFYDYSILSENDVFVRGGLLEKTREYKWDRVQNVDADYTIGRKNAIRIRYRIYLRDGTTLDAYNSEEFFRNILKLDRLIQEKNIPIRRSKINRKDYIKFQNSFGNKGRERDVDRLNVLLKVFNVE